jgi:hypothetical protein
MMVSVDTVYLGGVFTYLGDNVYRRKGFAAVDKTTDIAF